MKPYYNIMYGIIKPITKPILLHSTTIKRNSLFLGQDGWQGEWAKVYTDNGVNYICDFEQFLDGDASEQGKNCVISN